MTPPEHVRRKLEVVAQATGQSVEQIWAEQSPATQLAARPKTWQKFWDALSLKKRAALHRNWKFWGRPAQQAPVVVFFIWLILAGRGWGKTRTGAQWAIDQARSRPGSIGMLVAPTAMDLRDTMIHGDSGILACSPPDFRPKWEASKLRLTWPNGSRAICRTADSPERLRGPNLEWAWCDEMACWRYLQAAWDMLMFCLRKSSNPQVAITTTPRPVQLLRELVAKAQLKDSKVVLTRGSSWENYWNLGARWFREVIAKAAGALALQEVFAHILDKVEGALWSSELLDRYRIVNPQLIRELKSQIVRCVVGVDPPEESGPTADECGIVAVAKTEAAKGLVLEDCSLRGKPHIWARAAYELYLRLEAEAIVIEKNTGGEMAKHTLLSVVRDGEPIPRIIEVRATKAKKTRAEPISALYEEGRFSHLGTFARLEDEMMTYLPNSRRSPNRMDAMVWAAHDLFPQYSLR